MKGIGILFFILVWFLNYAQAASRSIRLEEFIRLAASRDSEFEKILIQEMFLKYQKALTLPPGDMVLSLKQDHVFFKEPNRDDSQTQITLSKLFPYLGTEIRADYSVAPSAQSVRSSSAFDVSITQPIAENAFGKSTRLLSQSVDVQVAAARFQIIEAYEDYLAFITSAYIQWYEDYENLKVGNSSYQENLKLLDDIKDRKKSRIALPVDVNKTSLQVYSREERLIEFQERYKRSLHAIERILRHEGEEEIIPIKMESVPTFDFNFEDHYQKFENESRTFRILKLLEEKTKIDVKRAASELLPSTNLLVSFEREGEEYGLENGNNTISVGVSIDWPIPDQVKHAEKKTSELSVKEQALETENAYYRLYVSLNNLYIAIQREEQLIRIAKDKIKLSKSVLKDEKENYSFGRLTLNDYIRAVNEYDSNRFNLIFHESQKKKLYVEWKRLADDLVNEQSVLKGQLP